MRSRPVTLGAANRRWPLLVLAPLLAVVAWPRHVERVDRERAELAPLRVAYPQVRLLDARALEAKRGRYVMIDVGPEAPRTRAELAARVGGLGPSATVVFRGRASERAQVMQAALAARVWGFDESYASLEPR